MYIKICSIIKSESMKDRLKNSVIQIYIICIDHKTYCIILMSLHFANLYPKGRTFIAEIFSRVYSVFNKVLFQCCTQLEDCETLS